MNAAARLLRTALAAGAFLICAGGSLAGERLSREETEKLFAKLAEAAKGTTPRGGATPLGGASSLQANVRLVERTRFLLDAEPVVSEGRIWAERPARYRKEIIDPKSKKRAGAPLGDVKSLLVIGERDLWVYFPASREAQHADIKKAARGKSKDLVESFMPWLNFNLAEIEKKYSVKVRTDEVPEGVTIRKVAPGADPKTTPARAPEKVYRIDYVPRDRKLAPNLLGLRIWVDGETPWPIRVEKRTKSGTMATEMREIVVDAPLEAEIFEFKPPRGTKVEELTD